MERRTGVVPELELTTPGFFLRPDYDELLAVLRRDSPVHPTTDGSVAISRYDDVRSISRDPERFVSGRGVLINDPLRLLPDEALGAFSILHLDPPAHAAYRGVINRAFTPRAVARFEDRIRTVAGQVLDAAPSDRPIDLVDELAAPIPLVVIAELLGLDDVDPARFRRWSDAVIERPDQLDGAQGAELGELTAFLLAHVDRPARRSDDLLGLLQRAPVGDRPLDRGELLGFCLTLLVAGNETTRTLLSGGAEALARSPGERAVLVAEPSLVPTAVEEMLRWVTPIQAFGRTAAVDVEVAGHPLPAGTFVVLLYASANRDESVYGPTADRFDVRRRVPTAHLAFGFGEHVCVGAGLARLEARIFFEELLARFPRFELVGEPTYARSTLIKGATAMPVILEP